MRDQRAVLSLVLVLTLAGVETPSANQQRTAPAYRAPLRAAVAACCAGLRLPEAGDMRAPWSLSNPNFAIEGDFNGDRALDVAVLLIDSRGGPTLALFEHHPPSPGLRGTSGRFTLAYRRRLDTVVDDVVIEAPQEIVLRLVKRGEAWAPEGGDVPMAYPHAFDAVEFATFKPTPGGGVEARLHLVYWTGERYAEY